MPITLSIAREKPSSALAFEGFDAIDSLDMSPVTLTDHLRAIQKYGARQHFARNEAVFRPDAPSDQVYRILNGTIRLCRNLPDGRRHIADFLLPGDLMGFVKNADQPVCAEAVTEVTLIAYPRACFERLAAQNHAARTQLLDHFSAILQTAQQHLFVLGCQKAKGRVASFLLRLADRLDISCGEKLELMMGRQDVADHLGITIETASRAFTALRSDGSILIPNAHQVILRDMDALRLLATEG